MSFVGTKPLAKFPWADSATGPTDIAEPADGYQQTGFPVGKPPRGYMNWVLNYCSNAVRYWMHKGICAYDSVETYAIGDRVVSAGGLTYECIQANTSADPKAPTNTAYWKRWGFDSADIISTVMGVSYNPSIMGDSRNGFFKLNSLTCLWMQVPITIVSGHAGSTTVTFAEAFSVLHAVHVGSRNLNVAFSVADGSETTTGCVVTATEIGAAVTLGSFNLIAIGLRSS